MNKATPFFVKLNAFLAAQKILATDERLEMSDELLTLGWQILYDLSGYARPTAGWVGR